MTSAKKVAANQSNGRKSRGPNTSTGKARASRNARRHGLATFAAKDPAMSASIKEMVDAICDGDDDPQLRQQAILIAESELWLSCIKREKLAAIERLRDATVYAVTPDTSLARGKARLRLFDVACAQVDVIQKLVDETTAAGRDPEREPLPPELEAAWPPPWVKVVAEGAERDECEALKEAIGDIERLLRYEQRAWSMRKKAMRGFMAVMVSNRYRKA